MKTNILFLMICVLFVLNSFAQENLWFSVSSGLSQHTGQRSAGYMNKGFNLQADGFVPFYRKGWDGVVKGSHFALGVNVSGDYTDISHQSPDDYQTATRYKVFRNELIINHLGKSGSSRSFSGLIGLQAQFLFPKFSLSPLLSVGYLNLKADGFSQYGTINSVAEGQQIALVEKADAKINGIVIRPQLKIGYRISSNITLFISPAIVLGPEIDYLTNSLQPQGGFNEQNTYEIKQLTNGKMFETTNSHRYAVKELNLGLSIGLKTNKKSLRKLTEISSDQPIATQRAEAQDFNTTRSNRERGQLAARPGQPIGGIVVKGGKNPGGNLMVMTTNDQGEFTFTAKEAGNYIFTLIMPEVKDLTDKENTSSDTTANRAEAQDFNTTRSNRERGQLAARPGQPIGGIVVKGGKNPGGNLMVMTTNDQGEFAFTAKEAGNYIFTVMMPEVKGLSDKENSSSGTTANRAEAQDFNTTRSNRERGQLTARPGQPIGGIVVKGGKNPGGNLMVMTSNPNGEILIPNVEVGNYLFQITTTDPSNSKKNSK